MKANPKTVDLRSLAPYFYELAASSLELFEEDEIVDTLTEVVNVAQDYDQAVLIGSDLQSKSSRDIGSGTQYSWHFGGWS